MRMERCGTVKCKTDASLKVSILGVVWTLAHVLFERTGHRIGRAAIVADEAGLVWPLVCLHVARELAALSASVVAQLTFVRLLTCKNTANQVRVLLGGGHCHHLLKLMVENVKDTDELVILHVFVLFLEIYMYAHPCAAKKYTILTVCY